MDLVPLSPFSPRRQVVNPEVDHNYKLGIESDAGLECSQDIFLLHPANLLSMLLVISWQA
jgi:hypothetical protein